MRKTLFTRGQGSPSIKGLRVIIRKVCCTNEVYTHANIRKNYCQTRDYMLNFVFFDPSYNMQSRHNLLVPLLISIVLQF